MSRSTYYTSFGRWSPRQSLTVVLTTKIESKKNEKTD